MRISGFTTTRPEMANTRTYEDFSKFLGVKPARIGLIATLYDQYTSSELTDALLNTYTLDKNKKNQWQRENSLVVEWELGIKRIKRVPFIAVPEGDGENAADIIFHFPENYYQKFDTFIIEKTRQLIIVMNRPQRINDKDFLVIGKILDDDYASVLAPVTVGDTTRFVTNYMPELHEEGRLFEALLCIALLR